MASSFWQRALILPAGLLTFAAAEPETPTSPSNEPIASEGTTRQDGNQRELLDDESVLSRSRQFEVFGGQPAQRASLALLAEQVKDQLKAVLQEQADDWKAPIILVLHENTGSPTSNRTIATRLLFSETGYRLQLDIHLIRGIEHQLLSTKLLELLVIERALRERHINESDISFHAPPWLVIGLQEAIAWQTHQSDRELYAAAFERDHALFPVDSLFAVRAAQHEQLDPASRMTFRISAGALVMALLEQPKGHEGFSQLLGEVAAFDGELSTLLRKHFPSLNLSANSLEKWWSLQLAQSGSARVTDVLSVKQTESALTDSLRFFLRNEDGDIVELSIDQWQQVAELEPAERVAATRIAQDMIVRLSYRCFPSYRPLLKEYQEILTRITEGKRTEKIDQQLTELQESRDTMVAKTERARDFLDWYEINEATEISGEFDDYIRLKERMKANPRGRTDRLHRYLNELDQVFERN